MQVVTFAVLAVLCIVGTVGLILTPRVQSTWILSNYLFSTLSSIEAAAQSKSHAAAAAEAEEFKSRYAEAASAQENLKEQLEQSTSELDRVKANLAKVRSVAWEAINKLKQV